jgi:nitrite reductase/ring-hydroxylating ferredoxin subunit
MMENRKLNRRSINWLNQNRHILRQYGDQYIAYNDICLFF